MARERHAAQPPVVLRCVRHHRGRHVPARGAARDYLVAGLFRNRKPRSKTPGFPVLSGSEGLWGAGGRRRAGSLLCSERQKLIRKCSRSADSVFGLSGEAGIQACFRTAARNTPGNSRKLHAPLGEVAAYAAFRPAKRRGVFLRVSIKKWSGLSLAPKSSPANIGLQHSLPGRFTRFGKARNEFGSASGL